VKFYDVQYSQLVADPKATLKDIYNWLGDDWSEQTEESLNRYLNENPQCKYGAHEHSIEACGLKIEEVCEAFKEYINVFVSKEQKV